MPSDTTEPAASQGREIMYRDALNEALREEMQRDETVFCLGVGIAERGGSYKVTEGLLKEFGSKRIIDTPISEACICGSAVGAAMLGLRPVAELMYMDFTLMSSDQISPRLNAI